MKKINLISIFLIITIVITRIANSQLHVPNMVPIGAIALFSGFSIKDKKLALLVPILGQFIADIYFQLFSNIPGFYDISGMLFNYGALMCSTALGFTMKQPKILTNLCYILGASTIFYIVSNLGFFVGGWNGYSISGLIKTYIDAIPFYKYSLLSDLIGGILLFTGFYYISLPKKIAYEY